MKNKNVPYLRFKEFKEIWNSSTLSGFCLKVIDGDRGTNYPNGTDFSSDGYCLFLSAKNVTKAGFSFEEKVFITKEKDESLRKGKLKRNDIVLTTRGSIGHIAFYNSKIEFSDLRINSGMVLIRNENKDIDPNFIYASFFSPRMDRQIKTAAFGSAQPQLTVKEINQFKFTIPTLPEQQKIASFLSSIDEKIQHLCRKKELLEEYKKGVMQQLFSGKLRFKNEKGKVYPKWEEKRLGEIAEKVSNKNKKNSINFVLTNSATKGIVSQSEYFDRDIANQNNLEGYYIVSLNNFVYNPRVSAHAPVGPIKRNKLQEGVMSPLYLVFKFKVKNLEYFEYFFETKDWHEYLESVANIGVRHDRMNISNNDFFKMPIPFPSEKEQQKITNCLYAIDKKITSVTNQITQTQTFKKGLLQQLFV